MAKWATEEFFEARRIDNGIVAASFSSLIDTPEFLFLQRRLDFLNFYPLFVIECGL